MGAAVEKRMSGVGKNVKNARNRSAAHSVALGPTRTSRSNRFSRSSRSSRTARTYNPSSANKSSVPYSSFNESMGKRTVKMNKRRKVDPVVDAIRRSRKLIETNPKINVDGIRYE